MNAMLKQPDGELTCLLSYLRCFADQCEYRAKRAADPTAVIPPPTRRKDRPSKPHGLTKQTYSAIVYPPGATHGKKWHVVAYFLVIIIHRPRR